MPHSLDEPAPHWGVPWPLPPPMRLVTLFLIRGGGPGRPRLTMGDLNAADGRGIGGRRLSAVEVAAPAPAVHLGRSWRSSRVRLQSLVPRRGGRARCWLPAR